MGSNSRPKSTRWRKSSYSGDTGGSCLECALTGPLAWRKSTYSSDQGGECVEIADIPTAATITIAIRDSKTPAGPILTLDPATFTTFLNWTATATHGR
ncbi:DUF397 domain-containing protein [Streptomyces sp. CWNU-52B]|uniref:DUF397 domain-containing protein n=1 Tax=unclassified Streptomyces TaxID=2593676 RepID=UPI0039C2C8CE